VISPSGNAIKSTYDQNGNLLSTTGPRGNITRYAYNKYDETTEEIPPSATSTTPGATGDPTYYCYDQNFPARLDEQIVQTGSTQPNCSSPPSTGAPGFLVTAYGYSDPAHPYDETSLTSPHGFILYRSYDQYGDLTEKQSATGWTSYAYNLDSQLVSQTSPEGNPTLFSIGAGNLVGISISPGGRYAYVANMTSSKLVRITLASGSVGALALPSGSMPLMVAMQASNPTTGDEMAYVTANHTGTVVPVDVSTSSFSSNSRSVASPVSVGSYPYGIAIAGSTAVVANEGVTTPGSLSFINTADDQVTSSIQVSGTPEDVAIYEPNSSTGATADAIATNSSDGKLDVFTLNVDTGTASQSGSISLAPSNFTPLRPHMVKVVGSTAYVTGDLIENGKVSGAGALDVVNLSTDTVTNQIPVGRSPRGLAVSANGETAYVANVASDSLSVISHLKR
jgi:YD repeat-containing protein/YVTN family beta-propeller protein